MGLRGRLAIFFLAITVVPLAAGVVLLQLQIEAQVRERSGEELLRTGAAARAVADAVRARAGDLAADLARRGAADVLAAGAPAAAERWLQAQRIDGRADVVALSGPDGGTLAAHAASPPPQALPGALDGLERLPSGPAPGALVAVREVRATTPARLLGHVTAGLWLDGDLLSMVAPAPPPGSGAAFVAGGRVLAAAGADTDAVPSTGLPAAGEVGSVGVGGEQVLAGATELGGQDDPAGLLVLWTPVPERAVPLLALGLLALALAAVALVWVLAGGIAAPVTRAAEFARRVAHGDVSGRLPPGGGRELSDLAEALNTMSAELLVDPLTRLWNRRYFDLAAEREFERAARAGRGTPLSLLVVDLDAFKAINDDLTHGGHLAGDEVLREVARRLREATRTPDVVARRGGDEFAVLLPDTAYDGAMATAERIRSDLAETPVSLASVPDSGGAAVRVTCSIGVATRPRHGERFETLLKAADDALVRHAKPQGGNTVAGADGADGAAERRAGRRPG